jgi:hypothetical protein
MRWVMNVGTGDLGRKFAVVNGAVKDPVVFPRREAGLDGTGLAGVYAADPGSLRFVPIDETLPDHVAAAGQMNDLLRREVA